MSPLVQAIIEIDSAAGASSALQPILGRSALQRHVYRLQKLGIDEIQIRDLNGDARARDAWIRGARKQVADLPSSAPPIAFTPRDAAAQAAGGLVIVVRGDAVYDARLYDAVFESASPVHLTDAGRTIGLAKLEADSRWLCDSISVFSGAVPGHCETHSRELGELPRYITALRRHLPPYWSPVASVADRSRAKGLILDSAQKGVLDFPARFLHPWPENRLAEWAADKRITPNQITIVSAAIGFLAAYLFATQRFGAALLCAVLAGILDGVDGKLARIKLLSSRFGDRLDHTLDVAFEFSWYIALGWGLAAGGAEHGLATGFAIIAVMVGARALSGVYLALAGHQIHDHTAFDRAVRLVAGRRNIYVVILVTGYFAGALPWAFDLVLWWGVATVGVYAARIGFALVARSRGRETRTGMADQPTDF